MTAYGRHGVDARALLTICGLRVILLPWHYPERRRPRLRSTPSTIGCYRGLPASAAFPAQSLFASISPWCLNSIGGIQNREALEL
jgi:hypothetical protein